MLKNSVLLITVSFLSWHCQNRITKEPIDVSRAIIKVDCCGIFYNEKRLDLGATYFEWEKILGKHDREIKGSFVWDKLGISVTIFWDNDNNMKKKNYGQPSFINERPVNEIKVYFLNLESSQSKAGELNHARDWKPFNTDDWHEEYLKENENSALL